MTKRFAIFALCLSVQAIAGERYLGVMDVTTSDKTNATVTTPFFIPPGAKITIQCDATAYVITDTTTAVTTSTGVKLSADMLFPTSVGLSNKISSGNAANGGATLRAITATGTANCKVYERSGTE